MEFGMLAWQINQTASKVKKMWTWQINGKVRIWRLWNGIIRIAHRIRRKVFVKRLSVKDWLFTPSDSIRFRYLHKPGLRILITMTSEMINSIFRNPSLKTVGVANTVLKELPGSILSSLSTNCFRYHDPLNSRLLRHYTLNQIEAVHVGHEKLNRVASKHMPSVEQLHEVHRVPCEKHLGTIR